MMSIRLLTYTKESGVPVLPGKSLFHSTELFHVYANTSGYTPYMMVAYDGDVPVAKLLAVVRRSIRWLPSSLANRCEIYEPCEFLNESVNKGKLFADMLSHLTHDILPTSFLIEFRNLHQPLFGYKAFRLNHYFPIKWMRVYNSLHSKMPEERLSASRRRQIAKGFQNGTFIKTVETEEELKGLTHMLKMNYSSKLLKYLPGLDFFIQLAQQSPQKEIAQFFIVKYNEKIIGGSICLFSSDTAYLLFSGGLRKTYKFHYPGILAVWGALKYAHEHGYAHFEFMHVGTPFRKYGFRDFILRFGGKQITTRRWYRVRWNWLNKLAAKLYV